MKTSIIPAQITSVEDRIAGSLSLTQIMLLLSCLFLCVGVYALVPEPNTLNIYKIILIATKTTVFGACAIRYKGKLLMYWFAEIIAYFLRPKKYVFEKNTFDYKDRDNVIHSEISLEKSSHAKNTSKRFSVDSRFIEEYLWDKPVSMNISLSKGGLRVKATKFER